MTRRNGGQNPETKTEKEKTMASENTPAKATAPADDGFVTVSDGEIVPETKIVFDTFGDKFTGVYLGMREVPSNDGGYKQARFQVDGEIYFTNANHSLREGLKSVRNGTTTRITYTSDLDTGMAQPMRVFMVEVARGKVGAR
jgi:hypothetical protein